MLGVFLQFSTSTVCKHDYLLSTIDRIIHQECFFPGLLVAQASHSNAQGLQPTAEAWKVTNVSNRVVHRVVHPAFAAILQVVDLLVLHHTNMLLSFQQFHQSVSPERKLLGWLQLFFVAVIFHTYILYSDN